MRTVIVLSALLETTMPWRSLRPAELRSAGGVPSPGLVLSRRLRR